MSLGRFPIAAVCQPICILSLFIAAGAQAQHRPPVTEPGSASTEAVQDSSISEEPALLTHYVLAQHPEGSRIVSTREWRHAIGELTASAETMAADDYAIAIGRLLATIGDGHTMLIAPAVRAGHFGRNLPIAGRAFHDGWWVTQAHGPAGALAGHRITHVDGVPIEHVMRGFSRFVSSDNDAWAHYLSQYLFVSMGFLRAAGLEIGDTVTIAAEAADGSPLELQLAPQAGPPIHGNGVGLPGQSGRWFAESETANFLRIMPDRSSAYLRLGTMEDQTVFTFDRIVGEVRDLIDNDTIARLIIDLRGNVGGNNLNTEPLRHVLAMSRFNHPGRMVILIDGATFSAAQNFVNRMERETSAVFIGEPTGGRPNSFGDAARQRLPASGLVIQISTRRWQDMPPMDQRDWIMPDIFVPLSYSDWIAGRDRALEAALAYVPDENAPILPLSEPWLRESQNRQWRPFWLH